jgi:WD40 repeat protein
MNVKVFETSSEKLIAEFNGGHKDRILAIDLSADSLLLASGGKDSTVVIWDFISKGVRKSIPYAGVVSTMKFSPDGKYLLFGGSGGKLVLYDINKSEIKYSFPDHSDFITSVAFSRDGKYIASSDSDGSVSIYDTETGGLINTLQRFRGLIRSIVFSCDSRKLISCGDNSRVLLWNFSDNSKKTQLEIRRYGFSWLLSVAYNENSKTYAVGSMTGVVRIVDEAGTYLKRTGVPVTGILFIPKEGVLLTVAIATRGRGVMIIRAMDMKMKVNIRHNPKMKRNGK